MAAIAHPQVTDWPARPVLRLVAPPVRRRSRAVYWRRRLALLVLVGGLALGALWLGGGPLTASGPAQPSVPASDTTGGAYVVRPGDTLWAIARRIQPHGDVRPLVHRLSAARHGTPLRAGEHILLSE